MTERILVSFLITLAHESGASHLVLPSERGSPVRVPLGGSGVLPAPTGAIAEGTPAYGSSRDDEHPAAGPTLHFAYARLTVEVRPTAAGLDLVVTALHRGTGEGLPGHTVRLQNEAGELLREAVTDRDGTAAFYALPSRTYQVEICS